MQIPAFSKTLLSLLIPHLLSPTLASAWSSENPCTYHELSVRLPPVIDPALNASNTSSPSTGPISTFQAPPPSFFSGTWFVTNISSASYRERSNLQWDLRPMVPSCEENSTAVCPTGTVANVINEISSWVPNDNVTARSGAIGGGGRSVASIYAFNTPRRLNFPDLNSDWDAVFDNTVIEGLPVGRRVTWVVLYAGLDANELPFMMVYEGVSTYPTGDLGPPVLNAISMNPSGPDEATLTEVLKALMDLGNEELADLVNGLAPTKWDHELQGVPVICGTQCMGNQLV